MISKNIQNICKDIHLLGTATFPGEKTNKNESFFNFFLCSCFLLKSKVKLDIILVRWIIFSFYKTGSAIFFRWVKGI